MKLSSKVLAGSLASAGMVLSLVAPALTAQAATTSGSISDGKVKGIEQNPVSATEWGSGDASQNGGLAIAYDDGVTAGKAGSASMQSNANVNVVSGLLVLDAVPDFGFGSAAMGTTVGLVNNKYNQPGTDSTNSDSVKITESRSDAPGFTLGAQISNFKAAGSQESDAGTPFTLNLKPTGLTDADGKSAATSNTNNVNLVGTDDTPATLINLDKGTYSAGQVNARFQPGDNNAKLTLGTTANAGSAKTSSVTAYNAFITWTLTAKPTVTA